MNTILFNPEGRAKVQRRYDFLKAYYQPGKQFWELGKEKFLKNRKALNLLCELQRRYPIEQDYAVEEVELTPEMISGNGKYSLD